MLKEIAIGVVILFLTLWGLVALIGSVVRALGTAQDGVSKSFAEWRAQRFKTRKAQLAPFVRAAEPSQLARAGETIGRLEVEFRSRQTDTVWTPLRPVWEKKTFLRQPFSPQSSICTEMNISEIDSLLNPDPVPWSEKESAILAQDCSYPSTAPTPNCLDFQELLVPPLQLDEAIFEVEPTKVSTKNADKFFRQERRKVEEYNRQRVAILSKHAELSREIAAWNQEQRALWKRYIDASTAIAQEELSSFREHVLEYSRDCEGQKEEFREIAEGFKRGAKSHVIARVGCILGSLSLPDSVPRSWDIDFDEKQRILIVEICLPDIVHRPPVKTVILKSGPVMKPVNQTERKAFVPKVHPAILLRVAFEILRNDTSDTVKLLVLNGWVNFDDPATGIDKKVYTASLMVEHPQVVPLNLRKVDPIAAFRKLYGKSAASLIEIIPIEPTLNLKRTDSRFVDVSTEPDTSNQNANLAAMEWKDFEHLIRELFEKEFAGGGVEVRVTQSSKNRGVDAIVINPDPLHGGKYLIHAKRSTKPVDVSAVRDLCAVVRKERASRGILVTTGTYGPDAYAFANNQPVALLNGGELLGLLSQHGYSFRIDSIEARRSKPNQPAGIA